MSAVIDVRKIAREASETFPALDGDNGAAGNFGQRMLTKHLLEKRQAGEEITEDAAQALRAQLFIEIDAVEPQSTPREADEILQSATVETGAPQIEDLERIISDTFHTSTDGSTEHIKHLRKTARAKVIDYLGTTDANWFARRRFMRSAKKLIQMHIDDMMLRT